MQMTFFVFIELTDSSHVYTKICIQEEPEAVTFAAHWLMDHRRWDTAGQSTTRKVFVATYCSGGHKN